MAFKRFMVIFFGVFIMLAQTANAGVSEDEVALGGLAPRTDISSAYEIYGNPDKVDHFDFYWGDGFKVSINNRREISSVITTADNGITTPSGIHVGCTVNDLYKMYGEPDGSWERQMKDKFVINYRYEGKWNCFVFETVNDKIVRIVATKNIK